MKAGQNGGAAGIVTLALEFHRTPTLHADLLHGRSELPPELGVLLKLAGGSEPDPEYAAIASSNELQAAALFFIEQALFRHDSDHYRVLGLAPGASSGQIKEHHRLLMRVFHPDREDRKDEWKDTYATRINLAYSALRDAEARHRYDATLNPATRPGGKLPAHRRASAFQPSARPHSRTGGLPPMLLRYLPQWVLGGTALIAFFAVTMIYLNNPPAPAALQREATLGVDVLHPDTTTNTPVGQGLNATPEAPLRPPAIQTAVVPQLKPPAPAPQLQPAIRKVQMPVQKEHFRPAAPDALQQPISSPVAQAAAPAELVVLPELAAVVTPTTSRAIQESKLTAQPDPQATLVQFMGSFERGDIQAFMALFDEVAIGRAGGKPNIRREHESLFRSTELRHIAIDGMTWSQEGDWIRGEGRYRTTMMRKGELTLRTETGVFRIQFMRHGDQALIMGLDLQPEGRT